MARLLHLFTALVTIILVLAACGGQQVDHESPESTEANATSVSAEESKEEAADESESVASAESFPVTVVDGVGQELTFEEPPERVIPYYNESFGHLVTIGIRPVAARANPEMLSDSIYLEDGESIPQPVVDGTKNDLDLEKVASHKPDLILAFSEEELTPSSEIAPVYLQSIPDSLESVQDELRNVAAIFGMEEKAEESISTFNDRVDAYAQLNEENSDMTVMKLAIRGGGRFSVGTVDDPVCQMLNMVATCEWENPTGDGWSYNTTIEGLLNLDPDIIILNSWADDVEGARAEMQENPLYAELTAVQNGMVFSTPGYENPIASNIPAAQKVLDTYMPRMFPESFPDGPLTDVEVQEILAEEADKRWSVETLKRFNAPPFFIVRSLETHITSSRKG